MTARQWVEVIFIKILQISLRLQKDWKWNSIKKVGLGVNIKTCWCFFLVNNRIWEWFFSISSQTYFVVRLVNQNKLAGVWFEIGIKVKQNCNIIKFNNNEYLAKI